MAGLRDSNGRIAIDEAEAEAEAKRLEQAKEKLEEARNLLNRSNLDTGRMRGETLDALSEAYAQLSGGLKTWGRSCDNTAKYIRSVVSKYKRLDREYALKIRGGKG